MAVASEAVASAAHSQPEVRVEEVVDIQGLALETRIDRMLALPVEEG